MRKIDHVSDWASARHRDQQACSRVLMAKRFSAPFKHEPLLLLLIAFACILCLAGGASRADVMGQVVVRAIAWISLIIIVIIAPRRPMLRRGHAIFFFLISAAILVGIQLVPLPPDLWLSLPGRGAFAEVATFVDGPAPWRPMAIVPSATYNTLGSLIVPFTILLLVAGSNQIRDDVWVKVMLSMAVVIMFVGLLQFAGMSMNNPMINRSNDVGGLFANRNHFALMMACGLLMAPAWAFFDGRLPDWRGPVVIILIPLFALAILASGSRMGMLVGLIALGSSTFIVRRPLRRALSRKPKWMLPALIGGILVALAALVALSIVMNRAVSINRALSLDPGEDLRTRGLPTVLAMTREYLPFGAGFGSFDALFRLNEPFDLLAIPYFNRVHNDHLEVVLDAGIPGLVLLLLALGWWIWMSFHAWRFGGDGRGTLPKLGSALLLIIIVASVVDYPVRTPIMMAVTVIAAVWLSTAARASGSALPVKAQSL